MLSAANQLPWRPLQWTDGEVNKPSLLLLSFNQLYLCILISFIWDLGVCNPAPRLQGELLRHMMSTRRWPLNSDLWPLRWTGCELKAGAVCVIHFGSAAWSDSMIHDVSVVLLRATVATVTGSESVPEFWQRERSQLVSFGRPGFRALSSTRLNCNSRWDSTSLTTARELVTTRSLGRRHGFTVAFYKLTCLTLAECPRVWPRFLHHFELSPSGRRGT